MPQPHPLSGVNPALWARLIATHGVDGVALPRVVTISLTSLLGVPLKLVERARFSRAIERAPLPAPLFIIGHWRSGTTHLHNLLSRDPAFGCVSYLHCGAEGIFLGHEAYARRLMKDRVTGKRPMDEMALSVDAPAEEDLGLARLSTLSSYHCFFFPRHGRELFTRNIMLDGLRPGELDEWKAVYQWFLRKVSLHQKGRPLVLKNPPNVARIRHLLAMFPHAKFIHIVRNPFNVFASTVHLWKRLLPVWSLQRYDLLRSEEMIVEFYGRMMRRYLAERAMIPPGQLAEVRFEDLEANPLPELERVYRELGLGPFERAREAISAYLATIAGYRKNALPVDAAVVQRVEKHWAFALEEWGYGNPDGVTPTASSLQCR